jgi:hypothetical protein
MRGIEAVLLVGFLGLVGVGIWNARQWLPVRGTQAAYSTPTNATPPADSKTADVPGGKKTAKKSQPRVKRDLDNDKIIQAPATSDQASATHDVVLADPPKPKGAETFVASVVPTRNDLPAGVTGVQIRSQFGDPTARVTESRDGRLVEQYYYFNRDRTQVTVATLKSGVIVSAASTVP